MSAAIYLDIIVATLLVATISYAVILNRKLGRLRADRSEFEAMLKKFVAATERAEHGVALLQRVADASAAELDEKRGATMTLRNDLEFLVSRADQQAAKLESLIAGGRTRELAQTETTTRPARAAVRRARPGPADAAVGDPAARYLFASPDAAATPEAALEDETEVDGLDRTPAWLASARKLAGAEEVLR